MYAPNGRMWGRVLPYWFLVSHDGRSGKYNWNSRMVPKITWYLTFTEEGRGNCVGSPLHVLGIHNF